MNTIVQIYAINVLLAFLLSLQTGAYTGDFELSSEIPLVSKLVALLSIGLSLVTSSCLAKVGLGRRLVVTQQKQEWFTGVVLVVVLFNLFGLFFWGIGSAGQVSSLPLAFVFNLVSVDTLAIVFYGLHLGSRRNGYFWLVLVLYAVLKIAQGWSGTLYGILLYEIYHRVLVGKKVKWIVPSYVAILCLGGMLYQLVFPLKLFIRTGVWNPKDFFEAMQLLITRLSSFNNLSYILENTSDLAYKISDRLKDFSFIGDMLQRVLPSFLYADKSAENTNRLVILATKGSGYFGSVDVSFVGNVLLFSYRSTVEVVVYVALSIVLTALLVVLARRVCGVGAPIFIFLSTQSFLTSGSFGASYSLPIFGLVVCHLILFPPRIRMGWFTYLIRNEGSGTVKGLK